MLMLIAGGELLGMTLWFAAFAAASFDRTAADTAASLIAFIAIAAGSPGCVFAGRWADECVATGVRRAGAGTLLGAWAMNRLERLSAGESSG